jgi:hypothetical protein
LWSVAFAPDQNAVAAGDEGGAVQVWRLADGRRAAPTDRELARLWEDLAADAPRAFRAVRALAGAPARAVPFLAARLHRVPAAGDVLLARLLDELGDDRFPVRERATLTLAQMGHDVVPALREALTVGLLDVEARHRVRSLLGRLGEGELREVRLLPGELRALRAVEALERGGTPGARRVLARLGQGSSHARLTQEARVALARLGGRPVGNR